MTTQYSQILHPFLNLKMKKGKEKKKSLAIYVNNNLAPTRKKVNCYALTKIYIQKNK